MKQNYPLVSSIFLQTSNQKRLLQLFVLLLFLVFSQSQLFAISVINSSTISSGGGPATSLTLTVPAGTTTNDVIIAHLSLRGGTNVGSIVHPTGWTIIGSRINNGTDLVSVAYYRIVQAGDPTSYQWTFSPAQRSSLAMITFRGVDPVTPINAQAGQANAASTTITAPSIETLIPNTLLVGLFNSAQAQTEITVDEPLDQAYEVQAGAGPNGDSQGGGTELFSATGSTGVRTASAQNNLSIGRLIALTPVTYTITGTILEGGSPLEGVSVLATGGHSQTVSTNSAGEYTFTEVQAGAEGITITPTLAGYSFDPENRIVDGPVTANITDQDFTASILTFTISGTILENGSPLENVTVTATGGHNEVVFTDNNGAYTLSGVVFGSENIVITPSFTDYGFNPNNININGPVEADITNQGFTAFPLFYTISGIILDGAGTPLEGVNVNATGGHTQTVLSLSNGTYTLTGVPLDAVAITITPTFSTYTFNPATIIISGPVDENIEDQNFVGSLPPSAAEDFFLYSSNYAS